MKLLICATCATSTSLDDDLMGEDNRHVGHNTLTVQGTPETVRLRAAQLGVHQRSAGVHGDGTLS